MSTAVGPAFAESSDEKRDWFQRPFQHVNQLPPGFYYVFKSGDGLPAYFINIPEEANRKSGEIPYIENREAARRIDAHYKTADREPEPRITFDGKAVVPPAETASGTTREAGGRKAASGKQRSPFAKNSYWSAIKTLPKSASRTLYGGGNGPNGAMPMPLPGEPGGPGALPDAISGTPEDEQSATGEQGSRDNRASGTENDSVETSPPATKTPVDSDSSTSPSTSHSAESKESEEGEPAQKPNPARARRANPNRPKF